MEPTILTSTMAHVPGPVTVVTTVDASGRRWGFTASSFSSVSLEPPLVLVCLGRRASTHTAFTGVRHFLVNVLAHGQVGVARRFATSGIDRFAAGDMESCELGLPGLPVACVRVACSTHSVVDAGDHSILIGRVEETHVSGRIPLVYYNRSFSRPVPARAADDQRLSALHLAGW
ncbi:flavin reductase (DIM6/NTAB) family NADH-FMN oxidoreductase RutF [Streptosporangium becharense]|uniref:Flavin reductase (DIM6/NTAB) family NADH-FMN oxidoreductase RutF n=1 Tax=Streptosporangium becharense TaxID=1816182 RepID=A0A7W9IK37_9ACTN|nr:flavin reductase family protein [Streptosporangium becharense]MBB2911042.1 flavin reductase (DIM6/NTAB) family NADH-FMN oxidoreductase RutF [Streptosporangium becharense]MBB5821900.1 flavin reductase (DIM6/NTAB) family NADH-FMN oxidoreductase RutF [Streptosporangium becharense]